MRRALITLLVLAAVALVIVAVRLGNKSHAPQPVSGARTVSAFPNAGGGGEHKPKPKIKAHAKPDSPFYSLAACQKYLDGHPRPKDRGPRIGTWNIRWFPTGSKDGSNPDRRTDLPWLACTIAAMDVDVLAVQEFMQHAEGKAGLQDLLGQLDKLTQGHWHAELDTCSGSDRQHVGFLFDQSRVQVSHPEQLAALNPGGHGACDRGLKPGYGMYAHFKSGPDVQLVALHLDSGVTSTDLEHRQGSIAQLGNVAAELGKAERDQDLIVLGDFNTTGCPECDPPVESQDEIATLDKQLEPIGLRRLHGPKTRECSEYWHKDRDTSLLDFVLVSNQMEEVGSDAKLELFGPCGDLGCRPPYKAEHPAALDRLSDHCPLVVQLAPKDLDATSASATTPSRAGLASADAKGKPAAAAPSGAAKPAPSP